MPIDEKQVTNKQHAVPQNIMDVDFKIIGDLTLREFFYLLVFFGLAYWAYMTIQNFFKWPMIILFILTGLIFARGRFGERGMDEWVVNFFRAIYNPTQKVWKKNAVIPVAFSYQNLDFVKNELITLAPTATRRKLESYLDSYNTVEEQKDDFEAMEEAYIRKVSSFNYSVSDADSLSGNVVTTVTDDIAVDLGKDSAPQQEVPQVITPQANPTDTPDKVESELPAPQDTADTVAPETNTVTTLQDKNAKSEDEKQEQKPAQVEKPTFSFDIKSFYRQRKPAAAQTEPKVEPESTKTTTEQIVPPQAQATETANLATTPTTDIKDTVNATAAGSAKDTATTPTPAPTSTPTPTPTPIPTLTQAPTTSTTKPTTPPIAMPSPTQAPTPTQTMPTTNDVQNSMPYSNTAATVTATTPPKEEDTDKDRAVPTTINKLQQQVAQKQSTAENISTQKVETPHDIPSVAQTPEKELPNLKTYQDKHTSEGMQKILSQMKQHQVGYTEPVAIDTTNKPLPKQDTPTQQTQTPGQIANPTQKNNAPDTKDNTKILAEAPTQEKPRIRPFMPKPIAHEDELQTQEQGQVQQQAQTTQTTTQTSIPYQPALEEKEKQQTAPQQPKPEQPPEQRDPMLVKSTQFRTPDIYKTQAAIKHEPIMPSITPDRVAGRRFTPLALDQQGTIILPIRGEKVLRTESSDDTVSQEQLEEKTRQLQILLEQIRRESGIISATNKKVTTTTQAAPNTTSATTPVQQPSKTQIQKSEEITQQTNDEEVLTKLKQENQRLIDEIGHLRGEMNKVQNVGNFQQQEQILQSASIEQEVLKKQIEELQNKISQQNAETEALRKREQKRLEDERKQAETLRLMMQMQAEKDRKEHEKKEREAREKYERERKIQEERQKEEEEKANKEKAIREAEQRKKQEELDRKFAQEEHKRIEQEQKRLAQERAKEQELQKKRDLEAQRQKIEETRAQEKAQQKAKQENEHYAKEMQEKERLNKEAELKQQKEQAEKALKEAEAKAYEEQKRLEAAKLRTEEERKRQEQAFKTLNSAGVPVFATIPPITNMPNSISGIVKNKEGKTIEGILVIIKRENGEPVRALKTNILGQFLITTPLSNGVYVVEVDKAGSSGEKFDIIKLTVDGKVIPPLDFTGH